MKWEYDHALPITMWDSSWLMRHYRGGSFEDYDRVIDELIERGYEAVRIDVQPHLIAKGRDGSDTEVFQMMPSGNIARSRWGAYYSLRYNVRKELVTFIHKLQEKGIRIAFSTWIKEVQEGRAALIGDTQDFIRIWDETLTFLQENGCLENVLYVDLLNEFPKWHGYKSFLDRFDCYEDQHRDAGVFYWKVVQTALQTLKQKWPNLRFLFSQCEQRFYNYDYERDYTQFDVLDEHMWLVDHPEYAADTKYYDHLHRPWDDLHYEEVNAALHKTYRENEALYDRWMEERIARVAAFGKSHGIPFGNTEGWGTIFWNEHPYLDWDLIKHTGTVYAQLAADHGFAFICSSNFCHPQFTGMWNDIAWHRQITDRIRKGKPEF